MRDTSTFWARPLWLPCTCRFSAPGTMQVAAETIVSSVDPIDVIFVDGCNEADMSRTYGQPQAGTLHWGESTRRAMFPARTTVADAPTDAPVESNAPWRIMAATAPAGEPRSTRCEIRGPSAAAIAQPSIPPRLWPMIAPFSPGLSWDSKFRWAATRSVSGQPALIASVLITGRYPIRMSQPCSGAR